jgi:inhibitor of KinA
MSGPEIAPLGDQAFLVRFGETALDEALAERVLALSAALEPLAAPRPAAVLDVVPGYTSVLVVYDPADRSAPAVLPWIATAVESAATGPAATPAAAPAVEIPVRYHPEVAPDLEDLAREKGLSMGEVIALHAAPIYRCHLLGFRPGFPFLGGLDPRLAMPRLATPRLRVAAGSVGIGGSQTGIYPVASPGGWRIIGRTSARLFDPGVAGRPFLVRPGDRVRFVPVDSLEAAS